MASKTKAEQAEELKPAEQGTDLAEMQKMIAAMLDQAKAEAAKIVADAKAAAEELNPAAAKAEADAALAAAKAESKAKGEELVKIKLFKDNGKYKDDVFVSVNGETIAIKRGEYVMVKRKFVEVLDNSEHQDYETSKLIEAQSGQFEADSAKYR